MPLLEIRDLKRSFTTPDGELLPVIDVPALTLEPGEQVALAGASGSGKTTLLNLIAGILRADSGAIVIDGTDIAALGESQRDRFRALHIGYVFQTFNLLQGFTALENVMLGMAFGAGADRERARALLEEVGLSDRIHYRPAQLSSGQQQRVALARALAGKPKLVLADEPTGSLDVRRATEAIELVRAQCAKHEAALLLVSHEPAVLEQFPRVEGLAELNRVLEGTPEAGASAAGAAASAAGTAAQAPSAGTEASTPHGASTADAADSSPAEAR